VAPTGGARSLPRHPLHSCPPSIWPDCPDSRLAPYLPRETQPSGRGASSCIQLVPTTVKHERMKGNALLAQVPLGSIKTRLLSIPAALVVFWIFVLLWGERRVFEQSVRQCLWHQWESWVCEASPLQTPVLTMPAGSHSTSSCSPRRRPPIGGSAYIS
jgi:hypothetical protein